GAAEKDSDRTVARQEGKVEHEGEHERTCDHGTERIEGAAQPCPRMHAINVRQHTGQLPTIHRRAPDAQEDDCDTGDVQGEQGGDQNRASPGTGQTNGDDCTPCGEEAEENGAGGSPFAPLRHLSGGAEGQAACSVKKSMTTLSARQGTGIRQTMISTTPSSCSMRSSMGSPASGSP